MNVFRSSLRVLPALALVAPQLAAEQKRFQVCNPYPKNMVLAPSPGVHLIDEEDKTLERRGHEIELRPNEIRMLTATWNQERLSITPEVKFSVHQDTMKNPGMAWNLKLGDLIPWPHINVIYVTPKELTVHGRRVALEEAPDLRPPRARVEDKASVAAPSHGSHPESKTRRVKVGPLTFLTLRNESDSAYHLVVQMAKPSGKKVARCSLAGGKPKYQKCWQPIVDEEPDAKTRSRGYCVYVGPVTEATMKLEIKNIRGGVLHLSDSRLKPTGWYLSFVPETRAFELKYEDGSRPRPITAPILEDGNSLRIPVDFKEHRDEGASTQRYQGFFSTGPSIPPLPVTTPHASPLQTLVPEWELPPPLPTHVPEWDLPPSLLHDPSEALPSPSQFQFDFPESSTSFLPRWPALEADGYSVKFGGFLLDLTHHQGGAPAGSS